MATMTCFRLPPAGIVPRGPAVRTPLGAFLPKVC